MLNHRDSEFLRVIRNYFLQPSHPVNLAVFRIVLFYFLYREVDLSQLVWLSHVPKELVFPPVGMDWFPHYFRIDELWITTAYKIFVITSVMSILGLFTRYSIFLTTILAFYLLGIPNFFGKVNHSSHHFVIFSTIMIVSRCSDVWSLDALIRSRKEELVPKPSLTYGIPIRIIWLMFGVIYFFAGVWKIHEGGLEWIFSENLKFHMYRIWYFLEWTPFFRIDQYPFLYKTSALLTILFEVSFIFFLFLGKLRYVAVFGGLLFHNMTNAFMQISFKSLQVCYVIFFDWTFLYKLYSRYILKKSHEPSGSDTKASNDQIPYAAVVVGAFLITGNIYSGLINNVNSWYFTCYPTFQSVIHEPVVPVLSIQVSNGDGIYKEVNRDTLENIMNRYQYARFVHTTYRIAGSKGPEKFKALWELISKEDSSLSGVEGIRIYQHLVSTVPEEKTSRPVGKKLLYEYQSAH